MNATTTSASSLPSALSHPFAHLGPAPYRFVGVTSIPSKAVLEAHPEAYYRAVREASSMVKSGAGSCAHCGTYITNIFIIQCGNGDRFGVGCDCIFKVDQEPKLVKAVKKAHADLVKQQRHANEDRKLAAAREWKDANTERMKAFPHPLRWRADKGDTLADYVNWYWMNAGTKGKLGAVKNAQQIVEGAGEQQS